MDTDPTLRCVNRLEDLLFQKVAKLHPRNTSLKTIATILVTLQKLLQVKSANAIFSQSVSPQKSQSHQLLDAIHQSLRQSNSLVVHSQNIQKKSSL